MKKKTLKKYIYNYFYYIERIFLVDLKFVQAIVHKFNKRDCNKLFYHKYIKKKNLNVWTIITVFQDT